MLKRSMVLLLVMVMLVSFSAAVLAADKSDDLEEGKAPKNNAGVRILVDDDNDGVKEIHFLDAVNDAAKENGNTEHPDNPIAVAGK